MSSAVILATPEMRAVNKGAKLHCKQQELSTLEQNFRLKLQNINKGGCDFREAQKQEEARLGKLQQELLQTQEIAEQELAQRRDELIGPLLEQIGSAIETVAQKQGLSYVLNTTTSSGDMIILYASEDFRAKFDITQSVMEELGMFN